MKTLKCIFIIIFLSVFISSKAQSIDDTVGIIAYDYLQYERAEKKLNLYLINNDIYYLDNCISTSEYSSKERADKLGEADNWNYLLVKAYLYKKDYDNAVKIIEKAGKSIVPIASYYNTLLILRINAMKAYNGNNIKLYKQYLDEIINLIQEDFNSNSEKYELAMDFGYSSYRFCISQYYYYKQLRYGKSSVKRELKKVVKKDKYDERFINELLLNTKKDLSFMDYNLY